MNKLIDWFASVAPWLVKHDVLVVIVLAFSGFAAGGAFIFSNLEFQPSPPEVLELRADANAAGELIGVVRIHASRLTTTGSEVHSDRRRVDADDTLMNRYPALHMWAGTVCVMTGYALACVPVFYGQRRRLKVAFPGIHLGGFWRGAAVFALGLVLFILPTTLPGVWTPVDYLESMGTFFAGPWALLGPVVMAVVSSCFGIAVLLSIADAMPELRLIPDPLQASLRHDRLRGALRRSLNLLAIMVAFAVLTSSCLRIAFNSLLRLEGGMELFPVEFVHVYGLFFSAVLAMIYLPIHFRLKEIGDEIEERLANVRDAAQAAATRPATPSPGPAPVPADLALIDRALQRLRAGATGSENIKLSFSILAPILTGLLSKFAEHVVK